MLDFLFLLPIINTLVAVASLILLGITIIFSYDLWRYDGGLFQSKIQRFLWPAILLVTSGGVLLSLVYSEIFLFVPCSLCWLQRIALYSQALIGIVAYRRRDTVHFPVYGKWLSLFGLGVALYQYVYQLIPASARDGIMPCLADGSADCTEPVLSMFGFITFPLVSLITFALLITLYCYLKRRSV